MNTRSGKRLVTQPLELIKNQIRHSTCTQIKNDKNLPQHILNLGFETLEQFQKFEIFVQSETSQNKKTQQKQTTNLSYYPIQIPQVQKIQTDKRKTLKTQYEDLYKDFSEKSATQQSDKIVNNSKRIDLRGQIQNPKPSFVKRDHKVMTSVIQVKVEDGQLQITQSNQIHISKLIENTQKNIQQQLRLFLMKESMKNNSKCILIRVKKIEKLLIQEKQKILEKLTSKYYP